MTRARPFRNRSVAAGSALLLAVLGGALAAPAQAVPLEVGVTPVNCPTAYPLSSVTAGTVGEGQTVVSGTTVEPFRVEVIGIQKNGIGAGKDLIIVNLSDLDGGHVVDQAGGGWAGISGSPVYVDGQLLGALSYGFTLAPSPLMGLTPAAYMNPLLDLGGSAGARARAAQPTKITLSATTKKRLAAKAGTAVPQGSLRPMPTPLGVSGLSTRRLDQLQARLAKAGQPYRLYSAGGGGSASVAGSTPTERPVAGGNFAVSAATGDLDLFATGTTTLVCDDQALAFGHPFGWSGPAGYTAHNARAVTMVKDDTLGSYKMANLGAPIGTLDQDRLAGVRADLTRTPDTATVTTVITNADTGARRTGTTQVSDPQILASWLPDMVFAGQDAAFDEWGDGVATSYWTISGTRAGGVPFTVTRGNYWASRYDVKVEPAYDVAAATDKIINNDFENVKINNVTFKSIMKTKFRQRHITFMSVSVNGAKFTSAKRLNLEVGDKLRIHVGTQQYRSAVTIYSTINMTVPKSARGQVADLSVTGGNELNGSDDFEDECLFEDECGDSSSTATSLNKIISSITSTPRNNAIVAELSYDDDDEGSTVTAAKTTKADTLTVTGSRSITARIR